MKRISYIVFALICAIGLSAQELSVIKLDAPTKTGGTSVMKVFSDRHSDRTFSSDKLKPRDLSNLLWMANGINRPDGKRTAPSAKNVQDVDVYVVMEEGAYLYDAKEHVLKPISKGDHRAAVASNQDFVKTVPVVLVLVSDLSRFGSTINEQTKLMAAVDIGIVCQNINIACAGLGLSTVPRAYMDQQALKKALKLSETQLLLMNNPVGYPKK